MNRTMATAAAVMFVTLPAIAADPTNVKSEITAFCNTWDTTWNTKGAAAVGPLFAEDGIFTSPDGHVVKGRDNIQKAFGEAFSQPSTHQVVPDEIRALTPTGNVALVNGEAIVKGPQLLRVRFTAVDVKDNGVWQIKALSASPIQEVSDKK
jgi:uncharacterized protein (TIGR02246 family)